MSTTMNTSGSSARGRYIPWIFVAGFAVVIAVNATMIWFAVGSFSGLYANRARETGLRYNAVIAEQKARDALHWQVATSWRADASRIELRVQGPDGRPLEGARATVELVRPAEKRPPIPVALGVIGSGEFAGYIDLPERGNWDLDIIIERAAPAGGTRSVERYATTRRMFLR